MSMYTMRAGRSYMHQIKSAAQQQRHHGQDDQQSFIVDWLYP
jgi:hypothetical protein